LPPAKQSTLFTTVYNSNIEEIRCHTISTWLLNAMRKVTMSPPFRRSRRATPQARSLNEETLRIREAIELCLEVEGAPEQTLKFVGIQRITIAA
jgi:hypothetical protein